MTDDNQWYYAHYTHLRGMPYRQWRRARLHLDRDRRYKQTNLTTRQPWTQWENQRVVTLIRYHLAGYPHDYRGDSTDKILRRANLDFYLQPRHYLRSKLNRHARRHCGLDRNAGKNGYPPAK